MNFTVLWLLAEVFSAKFGGVAFFGAAKANICENFFHENRIFYQFAKVSRYMVLKQALLYLMIPHIIIWHNDKASNIHIEGKKVC